MTKGEHSRQRLIACAAELFWKKGYAATGISEILNQTGLPKGSFYFYFKSKDDLTLAVVSYYQEKLLNQMEAFAADRSWEDFLEDAFAYLESPSDGTGFLGCPFAVMGMELTLQKPEIAKVYLKGIQAFETLFHRVLCQSGLSRFQAEELSRRFLAVYQGSVLLGRISQDSGYLEQAKKTLTQMYREYCALHGMGRT